MRTRNLWVGVLWAVALTLIVAGFGAGLWQSTFYYQQSDIANPGPVVQFFQQLAEVMKGPAIMVGFATIGGLLFFHARIHARKVTREQ